MITVDDGEIVGIGGLLDDNERRTIEKIPLLGDLPVIGNLFRSKSRSADQDQSDGLHPPDHPAHRRGCAGDDRAALRLYPRPAVPADPDEEPSIDELVREYMGTVPPAAAPPAPQPRDQVVTPDRRCRRAQVPRGR